MLQVANAGGVENLVLDTLGRILSKNYKDRVAQVGFFGREECITFPWQSLEPQNVFCFG